MLFTKNKESAVEKPEKISVHFKNKRTFTNSPSLPFTPKHTFSGTFKINSYTLRPEIKLVPDDVDYKTDEFTLFDLTISSTSTSTVIDRLCAYRCNPYMDIYLDTEKRQRASYIEIAMKH